MWLDMLLGGVIDDSVTRLAFNRALVWSGRASDRSLKLTTQCVTNLQPQ